MGPTPTSQVIYNAKFNKGNKQPNNSGSHNTCNQIYEQLKLRGLKLDGNAPHSWGPKAPTRRSVYASSTGARKIQRKGADRDAALARLS